MTEQVQYEVVKGSNGIEVRKYPPMLLARVKGSYDDASFSILFKYISGNNEDRKQLAMTAPVVSTTSGTRIPMTTPVISDESTFSFILPPMFDFGTAPSPLDRRIELVPLPSRHVATIRFSGRAYDREVMEKSRELLQWLKEQGIRPVGDPFLMRYNSPFAPGFMRRNEVGVEIDTQDLTDRGKE